MVNEEYLRTKINKLVVLKDARGIENVLEHSVTVNIAGFNANGTQAVFACLSPMKLVSAKLVSDTATTGSGASTKYALKLLNVAVELCGTVKNTDDDGEITVDTVWDLAVNQNNILATGDVIVLDIVKTGSPTSLATAEIVLVIKYVNIVS